MNIKLTFFCAFFISVICIGIWGYKLYGKYNFWHATYIKELNFTFHQAVLLETQQRLIDSNPPHYRFYAIPGKTKPEKRSITTASGTIYLKRTEEYEALSIEEKENLVFQTIFVSYGRYLKVNVLNDFWQEQLQEKRIRDLETGIKYRHRDFADTVYSNKDSLFFVNSSRIDWYVTGLFDEIDLQGHYNFSYVSLFNYAKNEFLIFVFIGGLLTLNLIVCFIFIFKMAPLNIKEFIYNEETIYRAFRSRIFPLHDGK